MRRRRPEPDSYRRTIPAGYGPGTGSGATHGSATSSVRRDGPAALALLTRSSRLFSSATWAFISEMERVRWPQLPELQTIGRLAHVADVPSDCPCFGIRSHMCIRHQLSQLPGTAFEFVVVLNAARNKRGAHSLQRQLSPTGTQHQSQKLRPVLVGSART